MEKEYKKASFSLNEYHFTKASINLENLPESCNFALDFNPSGIFNQDTGSFELSLEFKADYNNKCVVYVKMIAQYMFTDIALLDDIPQYFYANSIAIVFPYIRAFVSTLTLQANVNPIILPTLNMTALQDKLKSNTTAR